MSNSIISIKDLCGNEADVSTRFSNLQLSPLKYYEVKVKAFSNLCCEIVSKL